MKDGQLFRVKVIEILNRYVDFSMYSAEKNILNSIVDEIIAIEEQEPITDADKNSEDKPTRAEEILSKCCESYNGGYSITFEKALQAMEQYLSEGLRDEFDKMNCLIGYLERWRDNPISVPPFELNEVINEAIEYLKQKP